MDNTPVKNPFADVTTEEVYEAARLQGYIERIFEDFKSCVKNSDSYKALMEASEENIFDHGFLKMAITDTNSKKERLKEIATLASQLDCSASDFFSATIEVEGKPVIEKIIKQISFSKRECAETSKNIGNAVEVFSDSESSVLTSELSSLSDEIEIPFKDKGRNGKKPKIISFKSVNKAYKSMVNEDKKKPKRRCVKDPSKVPSASKGSDETEPLQKRKRKPNSRYISK